MGVLDSDSIDRAPADLEHWPHMMELSVEAMFAVDDDKPQITKHLFSEIVVNRIF